jgi:SMI1 / KNR4 family (SUKH-1)
MCGAICTWRDMNLGAPTEAIDAAERELHVSFPEVLRAVWQISNGLEYPSGWKLLPVFDSANPGKSADHIVWANTRGRWDGMDQSLVVIAVDDSGNSLVLRSHGGVLGEVIYRWDHETEVLRPWSKPLDYYVEQAKSRVAKIEQAIARSQKRRARRA